MEVSRNMKRQSKATPRGPGPNDPVILEVRRIRAQMWKEAGGTSEGLSALVARDMAAHRAKEEARQRAKARRGKKKVKRKR